MYDAANATECYSTAYQDTPSEAEHPPIELETQNSQQCPKFGALLPWEAYSPIAKLGTPALAASAR